MSYVIAIPSYRRSTTICVKTLAMLKRYGIDMRLVHVFVVPEEYAEYREKIESEVTVIAGVLGLVKQRKFITDYFPVDSYIVFLDDDIEDLLYLGSWVDLHDTFKRGFLLCEQYFSRLWGIYPAANKFFMSWNHSHNLKYIIGSCYGLINRDVLPEAPMDDKEDVWRTCSYYEADGVVVRMNDISVKSKYYVEPGGMVDSRTEESNMKGAKMVLERFPGYGTLWIRPRTGLAEVRLRAAKNNISD